MFSGRRIEDFREGWGLLFSVGSFGKPHYWRRRDLTYEYKALCGLSGDLTHCHPTARKPFAPGDFMSKRCKHCQRKHSKKNY